MNIDIIIFTILFSLIPIIVTGIPYLFLRWLFRGKLITQVYSRLLLGFIIFNFLYFVIPSIINIFNPPPDAWENTTIYGIYDYSSLIFENALFYDYSTVWQPDLEGFIRYSALFVANSIVMYLQYPMVILPFVFITAPFISFGVLYYNLRKKDKELSLAEKLELIQYELETSPTEQINERLSSSDWKDEKELFRALVSVLPISLYLLMALLSWLKYEEKASILQGTSLGWFLEIFFVYLAAIIFAVHLLYSTKFSYKGRFLGKKIRSEMIQSLSTVGAFISLIAISLFMLQYAQQIWTVGYFSIYFIMAVTIFVLILDIYEPFSMLILTRMIEYFKKKPQESEVSEETLKAIKSEKRTQTFKNILIMSLLALIIHLISMIAIYVIEIILSQWHGASYSSNELRSFYLVIYQLIFIILTGFSVYYSRKFSWRPIVNGTVIYFMGILIVYLWDIYYGVFNNPLNLDRVIKGNRISVDPIFISLIDILLGSAGNITQSWLTSVFRVGSFINLGGTDILFMIPELKAVDVVFADILGFFSLPYNLLSYWTQIVLFTMIFFYVRLKFVSSTHRLKDELVEKNIFSERFLLPTKADFLLNPAKFILVRNFEKTYPDDPPDIIAEVPELDRNIQLALKEYNVGKNLVDYIDEEPLTIKEFVRTSNTTLDELIAFFKEIHGLKIGKYKPFSIYSREYGYAFKEVVLDSLHIMMVDGRACFVHEFGEKSQVEPALVSGLFAAITSFAKEAVKSEEALRSIDHGDTYLTIEYGKWVFGAMFSSGQSPAVRKNLRQFLDLFEAKHGTALPNWLGDLDLFKDDEEMVDEIFYVDSKKSKDKTTNIKDEDDDYDDIDEDQ